MQIKWLRQKVQSPQDLLCTAWMPKQLFSSASPAAEAINGFAVQAQALQVLDAISLIVSMV